MLSCRTNVKLSKKRGIPQISPNPSNPLVNHHCRSHTTLDVLGVQFWFAPIFLSSGTRAFGFSCNRCWRHIWKFNEIYLKCHLRPINARIIGSLSPESEFDQQKCGSTQYTMIGHTPTLMWTQMDILQNTNSNDRVGRTVSRCFDHFPIWTLESCVNICLKKTDDTGNRRQWCHMLNVGYSRKYVVANLRSVFHCFWCF